MKHKEKALKTAPLANESTKATNFDKAVAAMMITVWFLLVVFSIVYAANPYLLLDFTVEERKIEAGEKVKLGVIYSERGNFKEALQCYNEAIKIYPSFAEAYINMGVTYKKSKDYKNAAACFEKAIELDTLFKLNAYNNLYDIALETKDSVNLVKYHELAKQSNNTRIDKYMQIAIGYMNRHIWDSSLAAYRIALENRLDIKSQYHDMLVFSYVSCSNLPEQQNNIMTLLNNNLSGVDFSRYDTLAFKKSLAYDLDLALNYSRIGFCLAKLEKYDEALIFLKQAYNIHPTYDDVSENIKYIENLLKSNTMSNLENK